MWAKYVIIWLFSPIVLLWTQSAQAQIATYEVRLGSLLKMQEGIGWPLHLNIVEGHDALMKLTSLLENQQDCKVVTPAGASFSALNPTTNRYEHWSDGCGLRVRNVTLSDEGRWRLTAEAGDTSITGWIEVHVEADVTSYNPGPITLQDGSNSVPVELTSLNNSYCLVTKPFTESDLVPGHCHVTLGHTTRAVQGKWNVLLGLPGRVSELHVDTNVLVEAERLNVGFVHDIQTNRLHLYCNIIHTEKNITFCRFQKTNEPTGYNIMDGLSDSRHSYYGAGFSSRECGMTIETVTESDYGTWRCTVGLREWATATTVVQSTPMQALIRVQPPNAQIRRHIKRTTTEVRTLFAERGTSFTIMCRADISLAYCWFQHPNGSQFTPVERQGENDNFWYTGESLQLGDCGITFAYAIDEDSGTWSCHMGPRYERGLEEIEQVNVRVTGPVAANDKEILTPLGAEVTLYCHTANGPRPLDYCRFLTPKSLGISIDPTVTAENAILDRYYFTPERDLDHGDCSLTISSVHEDDIGEWTCAALVYDSSQEAGDTLKVILGSTTRSTQFRAGMIGMSVGLVFLAGLLVGAIWYKSFRTKRSRSEPVVEYNRAGGSTENRPSGLSSTQMSEWSDNSSGSQVQIRT